MKKSLFVLLSSTLISCTSTEIQDTSEDYSKLNHIIFVPGFYGTKLKSEKNNSPIWLTAKNSFFGVQSVGVHGLELPNTQKLIPTTILDKVTVIPGLYAKDVYGDAVDILKNELGDNVRVHTLSFDWRKDYFLAVKKLDKLVRRIQSDGGQKVSLVAHSLGGLVSTYYLRYGTQEPDTAKDSWHGAKQFDKALIATVPYKGSLLSFRNVFKGVNFIYNKNLINADVLSSFETNYQMLPTYKNSFLDNDLNIIDESVLPFNKWRDNKWGFLSSTENISAVAKAKRLSFVENTLKKTQLMSQRIHAPIIGQAPVSLKVAYIRGVKRPTMTRGILFRSKNQIIPIFDKEDIVKYFPEDSYEKLFGEGDETLASESAEFPAAYKEAFHGQLELKDVEAVHSRIFDNLEVKQLLKRFFSFDQDA